ncbi:MAG: putative terminase large subunit [Prokaryotic dsDNA virus sp.]|nr:MAG: putative terminase large subunit [Prokaryotic dsDNA virus sp.]|tara:strand:- start:16336 stop:17898 length:1563 start_codon:yes stop_codon:yes gene_type:complete
MANINLHNVSKEEEALHLASKDLISFGKLFLPDDYLRSETPPFHYEIADMITNMDNRQVAVIIPRGHGKTVLTKCDVLKSFCFADKNNPLFYGWVSATAKLATGNMDYIKYHIEFNERIKYYFGNLKGKKWTETDVELSNGCKLISKSNISGIRGGAKLHKRYDLIALDDFEDENNTITPEARAKNSNLITAVVFPALEPGSGRLRINGTPVHYDSFINNLIVNYAKATKDGEDFSWQVYTRKAIDKKGIMLWDSWFGAKEMERKKKFYADSGQPSKFYQEYMMEVQSEDDAVFTRKHIKYWDGSFLYDESTDIPFVIVDGDARPVNIFVGVDPATDINRRDSDYSVLMVVAVDHNNLIYVIDYIRNRALPVLGIPGNNQQGIVDYIFSYNDIYHPSLFTIEETTMSRPIFQALKSEMMRRNDFSVKFREEKPGTRLSKRDRIQEVLAQRFSVGQIHIKKEHYDLEREIITFGPRMAHDDTIDALAYACKYANPPQNIESNDKKKTYKRKKPMAKSWVIA